MIDILLATYDGEIYLRDLLESLMSQSFTDWRLLIRDDGSKDKSFEIINEYHQRFKDKIVVINNHEGRLGPAASFGRIMEASTAQYVMFCDQDDVWLKDKIQLSFDAMGSLERKFPKTVPLLIYTDSIGTDQHLKSIMPSVQEYINEDITNNLHLKNLVLMNVAFGNTMIINRALVELSCPIPKDAFMHDWWVALVAAAFGRIDYIPQATILYRQHGKNACGYKKMTILYFLKIRSFINFQLRMLNQIKAFATRYGSNEFISRTCTPDDLLMVIKMANLSELSFWKRKLFLIKFHQGFPNRLKAFANTITL